jgi:PAS domain S-box-containing protein
LSEKVTARVRRPGKWRNTALLWIAALVVVAVTGLAYPQWRQYSRAHADAALTRATLDSVDSLLESLIDAETGQRGFLLTGEERYLEPYNRAIQQIPAELSTVSRLLAAQPGQTSKAARLNALTADKLAELRQTIELRRARGIAAAVAMVLSDRSQQTMDEIRALCAQIRRAEISAQSQASTEAAAIAGTALLATIAGSLVLFFLFALKLEPFASPDPQAWQRTWLLRYGAAVLAVAAITLLRAALDPFVGPTHLPFTLFFCAVAFAAWFGGFRPAVLATALSLLLGAYFFAAPTGSLRVSGRDDQVAMLMIVVVGFGMALLSRSQRGAVDRALRAENSERTERQRFEITLGSIGDAVISTDTQGRVTFANQVALSLLRRPEKEVTGKPLDEVFHIVNEVTRQPVENPVNRVLREGAIVGLANHTVLIAADGTEIPIDDSAAPIQQEGRTVGVVLVFRDTTERRRAQQDAAYLAAIVESSDDAIVGQSPDSLIRTWNAGAERLYGYKAEEVVGRPMHDLVPPDRRHEESEILQRLRDGAPVVRCETVRARKDGTLIDVALTMSPIRNSAREILGFSHVARDITEQKKTGLQVLQAQKLESLGVLAGGIAHDFNNLLTGILGNASLALEDLTPGTTANVAVQSVLEAAERAAQLARQMLAYSGKGHFVLEHIDLSARVQETLPLIRAAIPANVALELDLDQGLPLINADTAQMQQLIMNIIINGAEAIPEGTHGKVTITTRPQNVEERFHAQGDGATSELQPGLYVMLEVRDTGSGMDEETRARIFDPFFTTKFTGRGLGLAAVLGIVRGHRGSIQVLSAPAKGTVFRVLFPAVEGKREANPSPADSSAVDLRGAGAVLVVDDEQTVRNAARQALERFGYTVLVAEDGSCGLDLFRREADRLKCVVLDLTMPVMSGEETLARMKAVRADIPIILSSGFNEVQAVRRFEGKGLAGFLQKPYRAGALVEMIQHVVSGLESE